MGLMAKIEDKLGGHKNEEQTPQHYQSDYDRRDERSNDQYYKQDYQNDPARYPHALAAASNSSPTGPAGTVDRDGYGGQPAKEYSPTGAYGTPTSSRNYNNQPPGAYGSSDSPIYDRYSSDTRGADRSSLDRTRGYNSGEYSSTAGPRKSYESQGTRDYHTSSTDPRPSSVVEGDYGGRAADDAAIARAAAAKTPEVDTTYMPKNETSNATTSGTSREIPRDGTYERSGATDTSNTGYNSSTADYARPEVGTTNVLRSRHGGVLNQTDDPRYTSPTTSSSTKENRKAVPSTSTTTTSTTTRSTGSTIPSSTSSKDYSSSDPRYKSNSSATTTVPTRAAPTAPGTSNNTSSDTHYTRDAGLAAGGLGAAGAAGVGAYELSKHNNNNHDDPNYTPSSATKSRDLTSTSRSFADASSSSPTTSSKLASATTPTTTYTQDAPSSYSSRDNYERERGGEKYPSSSSHTRGNSGSADLLGRSGGNGGGEYNRDRDYTRDREQERYGQQQQMYSSSSGASSQGRRLGAAYESGYEAGYKDAMEQVRASLRK